MIEGIWELEWFKSLNIEWFCFAGNVLGVRDVFLPDYPLVLSLFEPRGVWVFLN